MHATKNCPLNRPLLDNRRPPVINTSYGATLDTRGISRGEGLPLDLVVHPMRRVLSRQLLQLVLDRDGASSRLSLLPCLLETLLEIVLVEQAGERILLVAERHVVPPIHFPM